MHYCKESYSLANTKLERLVCSQTKLPNSKQKPPSKPSTLAALGSDFSADSVFKYSPDSAGSLNSRYTTNSKAFLDYNFEDKLPNEAAKATGPGSSTQNRG